MMSGACILKSKMMVMGGKVFVPFEIPKVAPSFDTGAPGDSGHLVGFRIAKRLCSLEN